MPSIAEIAYCKASVSYKLGSASLDGPLPQISNAIRLRKSYVGHQTEDPTTLFWVNDWVANDARDGFDYGPAFDSKSKPTVNCVEFEDAEGALGAPITEFVTFTLKEGKSIAELESLVKEIHQKLAGTPKFHGDSWGPIVGKPNVYHGILGWDTVDAHWEAVSGGPLKEVIDRIRPVADLWLVHAALKQYESEHA